MARVEVTGVSILFQLGIPLYIISGTPIRQVHTLLLPFRSRCLSPFLTHSIWFIYFLVTLKANLCATDSTPFRVQTYERRTVQGSFEKILAHSWWTVFKFYSRILKLHPLCTTIFKFDIGLPRNLSKKFVQKNSFPLPAAKWITLGIVPYLSFLFYLKITRS